MSNSIYVRFSKKESIILLNILAIVLLLPYLGGVPLFDWDEINFAEAAREMLITGDYLQVQINYEPFWEKPPLFFWMQALSMKIWGINAFAARFPNFICGLLTINTVFFLAQKHYQWRFGAFWAAAWLGSILPHFYFRSGIIDPWFNYFIFLSIYFVYRDYIRLTTASITIHAVLAGIFAGLAVLTKGPVAWLLIALTGLIILIIDRFKNTKFILNCVVMCIVSLLTTALWFGFDLIQNGTWFIETFINYQIRLFATEDAGHGGFLGYHFVILFFGCFPISIFAIPYLFKKSSTDKFRLWMLILCWVVLLLFTIVQSKIIHYSSLAYYPLTYLGALYLYKRRDRNWHLWMRYVILILLCLLFIISLVMAIAGPSIHKWYSIFNFNEEISLVLSEPGAWSWRRWIPVVLSGFMLGIYLMRRMRIKVYVLFLMVAIFLETMLYAYVNTIYHYTYAPLIEFYHNHKDENAYIDNYGFKTYSDLFYSEKMPEDKLPSGKIETALSSKLQKPLYIVAKYNDEEELLAYPNVKILYKKRNYIFAVKIPASLHK